MNWTLLFGILLFALIPGFIARKKGRSFLGYYLLSLVITPLITFIITLCLSNLNPPKPAEQGVVMPVEELPSPVDEQKITLATTKSEIDLPSQIVPTSNENNSSLPHKRFCKHCGFELLEGSIFCSKCGISIEEEEASGECPECNQKIPDESEFCQYCGIRLLEEKKIEKPVGQIETVISQTLPDERTSKTIRIKKKQVNTGISSPSDYGEHGEAILDEVKSHKEVEKQRFQIKKAWPILLLAGIVLILAGTNIAQYIVGRNNASIIRGLEDTVSETLEDKNDAIKAKNAQLNTKDETISNLEEKVKEKDKQITELKTKISSFSGEQSKYQNEAKRYEELCKALDTTSLGYSSSNFKTSDGVIVVKKSQTNRKFKLTANWSNGGTVNVSYSGDRCAEVSFDNESWITSTTMTVIPKSEGITTVTFSNDVNSLTFKMVIVVTD